MTKANALKKSNPISMFDITIAEHLYKLPELQALLNKHCKRWCFQLEQGDENDYKHYQLRLSMKVKIRFATLINKKIFKGHIKPTSNTTYYLGDEFYVMKEDTRLKGPWNDRNYKIMTKQLTWFMRQPLRAFQQKIIELSKEFEMRTIYLVYDRIGNCGKSLLCELMEYEGDTEEVPPYRLMDDIFQWVASRPIKKTYIIDMPRGMKKDKLADLYSGIEVIKNGVAYDKRYKAFKIRFDRPQVFVFTNVLPNFKFMSYDKWRIMTILPGYQFKIETVEEYENNESSDEFDSE